jgi:hypothetical protein
MNLRAEGVSVLQGGTSRLTVLSIEIVNGAQGGRPQVEERMQFNRALVPPESSPGEPFQAQVDRGGIEGVGCPIQFGSEVLAGIHRSSLAYQDSSQVGVDAPVAALVGMDKSVAGNAAPKPLW